MESGADVVDTEALTAQRRAERTRLILRLLFGLELVVVALAFLDSRNDPLVTATVHTPSLLLLATGIGLDARGHARVGGWIASTIFWVIVAGSTWFFGGLRYEMGSAFVVSVMIAAATLGNRSAALFGGLSIGWSSVVTIADLGGLLPPSLAPDSAINGWIAVTMSIGIASSLLYVIMRDLQRSVVQAAKLTSERDAAMIQLLQAQRMEPMGRLAGGVAHDFNNLLTVFIALAALLRDCDDPTERAQLVREHDEATAKAAQMTAQLLAFSRRRERDSTVVDLMRVVDDLAPVLSRLIGDEIALQVKTTQDVAPVRAAPGQLEQVILNLAVNARDAMPSGGRLTLRCAAEEAHVLLVVEDSGMGMDPATAKSAFSPFFTTKSSGTGLGLATVADIIEACEGTIDLRSRPGDGTRFEVRLPRQPTHALVATPRPASSTSSAEGRILLVDDDDLVRRSVRRLLEREGFEVTPVTNGVEALSLIGSQDDAGARFDLVVSDVMMPRLGGRELVAALEERGFDRPVLLISGDLDGRPTDLDQLAFRVGFVPKPFTRAELLQAVHTLLARGRGTASDAAAS